ncbi:hypothetical protein [Streptomyces nigra]|uniref:hypothetical protein n=1 Tax=Streptomyces nigra TaxID=1827580 RepID=UPI0026AD158B
MPDPAARSIPRTHIHCVGPAPEGITRRPAPATQPNGSPSRAHELPTGHDCMIPTPKELGDPLLNLSG